MATSVKNWRIGDRIKIRNRNSEGLITFVGATDFAPGTWVGVILDVRRGKNDGSVGDTRYFSCPEGHGLFVRKSALTQTEKTEMIAENISDSLPEMRLTAALLIEKMRRLRDRNRRMLQGFEPKRNGQFQAFSLVEKTKDDTVAKILNQQAHYLSVICDLKRKLKWASDESKAIQKNKGESEQEMEHLQRIAEYAVVEKEMCEDTLSKRDAELMEVTKKLNQFRQHCSCEQTKRQSDIKSIEDYLRLPKTKSLDEFCKPSSKSSEQCNDSSDSLLFTSESSTADKVIDQMTEKIISLEQTNISLQIALHEVESLRKVDAQLAKITRSLESDNWDKKMNETNVKLGRFNKTISELFATVCKNEEEIGRLRQTIAQRELQVSELEVKLQERKHCQTNDDHELNVSQYAMQMENLTHELQCKDLLLDYWSPFLPKSFFSQGGVNEAIIFVVTLEKLLHKTSILITQLKLKSPDLDQLTSALTVTNNTAAFDSFCLQSLYRAVSLESSLHILRSYLDDCSAEEMMLIGPLHAELSMKAFVINHYVLSVCQGRPFESCGALEKLIYFVEVINYRIEKSKKPAVFLQGNTKLFQAACDSIHYDLYMIAGFLTCSDNESSHTTVLTDLMDTVENVLVAIKDLKHQGGFLNADVTDDSYSIGLILDIKSILEKNLVIVSNVLGSTKRLSEAKESGIWKYLGEMYSDWHVTFQNQMQTVLNHLKHVDMEHFGVHKRLPMNERTITKIAEERERCEALTLETTKNQLEEREQRLCALRTKLKETLEELSLLRVKRDLLSRDLKLAHGVIENLKEDISSRHSDTIDEVLRLTYINEDLKRSSKSKAEENAELTRRIVVDQLSKLPPLLVHKPDPVARDTIQCLQRRSEELHEKCQRLNLSLPVVDITSASDPLETFRRQQKGRLYSLGKLRDDVERLKDDYIAVKSAHSLF